MIDTEYLKGQIREIRETMLELRRLTSKPYGQMPSDERYSLRYQIVVLVEALGSLCLHIAAEDFKCEPESYSECFNLLEKRGLVGCAEDLIKLSRLRNLVVHRYWVIDDSKVYDSIRGSSKCVQELVEGVSRKYDVR
jgi:uncharacterized protein YutE (UPF0331/DUF86 family)